MLTFFIFIILAAIVYWIDSYEFSNTRACNAFMVSFIVLAFALPWFLNFGYEEPVSYYETEVVSVKVDTSKKEKTYLYKYAVENNTEFSGDAYEYDIANGNVTEVISKDCEKPILKVYVQKSKGKCFAFNKDKYSYVFYLPEDFM